MLKAIIEITVTTSKRKDCDDPHNFWTVQLLSRTGDDIKNILEQDFSKSHFSKADAANEMLDNWSHFTDLVFGD